MAPTRCTTNAAGAPNSAMTAAPTKGPMIRPMRIMPPNSVIARARRWAGTSSARYVWRPRSHVRSPTDITRIATANSHSRHEPVVGVEAMRQPMIDAIATMAPSMSAARSPMRWTSRPVGIGPITASTPAIVPSNATCGTLMPSRSPTSGTTGTIAAAPPVYSTVGRYTGRSSRRSSARSSGSIKLLDTLTSRYYALLVTPWQWQRRWGRRRPARSRWHRPRSSWCSCRRRSRHCPSRPPTRRRRSRRPDPNRSG